MDTIPQIEEIVNRLNLVHRQDVREIAQTVVQGVDQIVQRIIEENEQIVQRTIQENEQHQVRLSNFQTVLALLVGWFLSEYVTPTTIFNLLHHIPFTW